MRAAQVVAVLAVLGIESFLDSCNPSYAVHLVSGTMIDANDVDGPWSVITLDREFSEPVSTPQELAAIPHLTKETS